MRATSRPSTFRSAAVCGACAALALAALPALATAAIPIPVPIPDEVFQVGGAADGSVHMVTTAVRGQYAVVSVAPTGVASTPVPITLPGKDFSASGIGPDGSTVFASWHRTHGHSGQMFAVPVSPTGVAGAAVPLTGFGPTVQPDSVHVGPTGAVAIAGVQTSLRAEAPTLVFKPAGAAPYGPGIALGAPLTPKQANIRTVKIDVALGPDGGGAVLVEQVGRARTPAPVVRRLSPDGQLGPAIAVPIGAHFLSEPQVEIAPSGTVAMLFDTNDATTGGKDRNQAILATLAPGATAVSAPQQLGVSTSASLGADNVWLAVGANDQAAVLAGPGPSGIRTYTGPLTALTARPSIPAKRAYGARVVVGADGSATAVWSQTDPGKGPDTIAEAHAPAGGAFAPPVPLTAYKKPNTGLLIADQPVALPNGDVALAYAINAGLDTDFIRFTP